MDKVLTTVLLVVASVIASIVVVNSVMPSVQRAGSDITAASAAVGDRVRTDVRIIETAATAGDDSLQIWAKNVGASSIRNPDRMDAFFGQIGAFGRIAYDASTACSDPGRTSACWQYALENDTQWSAFATVRVTVYLTAPLASGADYVVTLVLPNGVVTTTTFSL